MQVEKAWPGEGKQEEVGSKGGGRVEKRKEEVEVGEKEGRSILSEQNRHTYSQEDSFCHSKRIC